MMEEAIRERFSEVILVEARQRYAIAPDKIRLLDGFESFIYEFEKDAREYILRIGHSLRRSPELIYGEVDWINYLAAGGAGVAKAVLSENGELVELIDDRQGGLFLATAFVKAPGGPAWVTDRWDERLFAVYGRLLGRIHKLSKSYQPANISWKRPSWDDPIMLYVDLFLPEGETAVRSRYNDLMVHLQSLPQDADGFGMIHQDAHAGNFFVDENYRITLFDFDDCVYGHFIYDIAMVLFYAVTNNPNPEEQLTRLWSPFVQGYVEENELDSAWLAEIPHFMKLREIDLYAVLIDTFGYEPSGDKWIDTFMHGRQECIISDVPYVNFEFTV
ncbi:MAG: phosphotransferase [Chloroflexi bacterium]|nr:phosphotransferase [Chloroflexota bacterium]